MPYNIRIQLSYVRSLRHDIWYPDKYFFLRWYLGKTLEQLQSLESIFDRLGAPKLLEYIMVQWKMAGHLKGNYLLEMSTHFFTKNPWLWGGKGYAYFHERILSILLSPSSSENTQGVQHVSLGKFRWANNVSEWTGKHSQYINLSFRR